MPGIGHRQLRVFRVPFHSASIRCLGDTSMKDNKSLGICDELMRLLECQFPREIPCIFLFVSRDPHNLLPGIFSVFLLVLYGILVTKSRCLGCHKKRKPGCIFLEGDTTPGHQLYAVIVDTGFRSPAQFTSKVTWTPNRLLVRSERVDEP